MLKAGLVSSKNIKSRDGENPAFRPRRPGKRWKKIKAQLERDKQLASSKAGGAGEKQLKSPGEAADRGMNRIYGTPGAISALTLPTII